MKECEFLCEDHTNFVGLITFSYTVNSWICAAKRQSEEMSDIMCSCDSVNMSKAKEDKSIHE